MNQVFLRTAAAFLGSLLFIATARAQEPQAAAASRVAAVHEPQTAAAARAQQSPLRIVLIRHAEKPKKGDNLTCQGLNRSMQLPAVLHSRFGLPENIYVPSMALGDSTRHSRMFQTIVPFAAKYNLPICSKFQEDDTLALAQEARSKKGTVLVVWEHSRLPAIARCLGVTDPGLHWPDKDFDSIWIITYHNGVARLKRSKEGLHPSTACPY